MNIQCAAKTLSVIRPSSIRIHYPYESHTGGVQRMKETNNQKKSKSFNFIFIDDDRSEEEAKAAIQFVVDTVVQRAIKNFPATDYDITIKSTD